MVRRCPFLVSKFNNYTNQHCLTETLHTKMGHLRKLYVACSPLMCNTTNLIKGYARHSMIQQQVDKGFLLHQFYCNQFYLKIITKRRNPLELYLKPSKQLIQRGQN